MSLWNTIRVLFRRWHIALPGLLMSCVLAAVVFAMVPPKYESGAVAMLVQPKSASATFNPLLAFDPSLTTAAQVVIQSLNTPEVANEVGVLDNQDTLTISDTDSRNASDFQLTRPFLYVTAQSPSAEKSAALVSRILDEAQVELVERQKALGVSSAKYIRFQGVVDVTTPTKVFKSTLLATCVALIIGLILTLVAVYGSESFAAARAARVDAARRKTQLELEDEALLAEWRLSTQATPPGARPSAFVRNGATTPNVSMLRSNGSVPGDVIGRD
jgi:capsular polysaccharide biosynthesis protein